MNILLILSTILFTGANFACAEETIPLAPTFQNRAQIELRSEFETFSISSPILSESTIIVESEQSIGAFVFIKISDSKGAFKYRFHNKVSGVDSVGEGEVFENYARKSSESKTTIVDKGSVLEIKIDTISLRWSFRSNGSAYIYWDPTKTSFMTISGDRLNDLVFTKSDNQQH